MNNEADSRICTGNNVMFMQIEITFVGIGRYISIVK